MIDKAMNTAPEYSVPAAKVVSVSTKAHILNSSMGGSLRTNDYNQGSDSYVGFGDDED